MCASLPTSPHDANILFIGVLNPDVHLPLKGREDLGMGSISYCCLCLFSPWGEGQDKQVDCYKGICANHNFVAWCHTSLAPKSGLWEMIDFGIHHSTAQYSIATHQMPTQLVHGDIAVVPHDAIVY